MRGQVLGITITWLLTLITHVHAANFLSHAYERLWLWEMYELFCDIEGGAKNQNMIFKQQPKGWENFRNIGLEYPDGKLTYVEFQMRLNKEGLYKGGARPNIKPPAPFLYTIHEAAQDLQKNGMNGLLAPTEIDHTLKGQNFAPGGANYDANDPYRDHYTMLMDRVEKQYTLYRKDPNLDAKVKLRADRIHEITKSVVALRKEDSQNFLSNLIKKSKANGGYGMPDAVIEQKKSEVPGGKDYGKVDVTQTHQKYANDPDILAKAGFQNRGEMFNFINQIMDPKSSIKWSDSMYSHWRTMKSWKTINIKSGMTTATLRSCA